MILKLVRWTIGYTSFELIAGASEQFLSVCAKENINIWNIKKSGEVLKFECFSKEKENISRIAKISNGILETQKNFGLSFIISKYKKRTGILIGVSLFVLILWALSLFIWNIEIVGNEILPKEQILTAAKELGLKKGMWKSAIDSKITQQQIMINIPEAAWISVNIDGSKATIRIKEKVETPEFKIPDGTPCNIISKTNAQIERIETYGGTAMVNPGEIVVKGQILISGIMEGIEGASIGVTSANGKIYGKTKKKITEKIKLSRVEAKDTGKIVTLFKINAFGKVLPANFWQETPGENYRLETYTKKLQILGYDLPISFAFENYYEQECEQINTNLEEALQITQKSTENQRKNLLEKLQILDTIEEKKEIDGHFILETTYSCLEEIGEKSLI